MQKNVTQAKAQRTTENRGRRKASLAMKLYDYQRLGARRLWNSYRSGRKSPLFTLPTGTGKTVVAAHMILEWIRQGKRVLFLAHTREIILQTVRTLESYGVHADKISVVMRKHAREDFAKPVQVASIQTLRLRRKKPEADVIIVDEAHRAAAKTYQRLMRFYPGAIRLGLSATPYRLDGRGLSDVFDELVIGATASSLVGTGRMSKTRIWSVPREQREKLAADLKRVRTVAGDYDRRELGRKMSRRSLVGDIVSHWKRLGDERPTVVYGVTIAHAKRIEKAFKRSRITVELVHAKTRADDRHAMLERLRAGDTKVIVNCMILTEGWDCPVAKCIVLARPTKSLGLYLQMLGRGTRPGKTLIVLDHSGMAHQHGFPDTDRNVSLDGVEKSAGGRAPCKVCPSCDAVIAAAAAECPECGLAFLISREPDEKAGTLSEIDRQSIDANVDQFAKRAAQAGLPSKVVAALASSRRAALTRAQ